MMKVVALWAAVVVFATPAPVPAQSDTARSLINLLRAATDRATDRRPPSSAGVLDDAPELFLPLQFRDEAGPIDPANRRDPRNLDVAGVRLGMTPSEAGRALQAAGYTDTGTESDQPSYQHDIRAEWSRQSDKPYPQLVSVPEDRHWLKGKQRVAVTFLALPTGPIVNEIRYTTEDANLTSEAFVAQVRAKYGPPVNDHPTLLRWCTMKAPECEEPSSAVYPILAVWTDSPSLFLGGNDPARSAALEVRRTADIASRKPPEPQAAF